MQIIKKENWWVEKFKPLIECPNCDATLLGDNAPHGVRENGEVYESVVCNDCEFHDFVKLENWNKCEIPHS